MGTSKKRRNQRDHRSGSTAGSARQPGLLVSRKWSFNHLLLVLLVGFGLGLTLGYFIVPAGAEARAGAAAGSEWEVRTDGFGRTPSDPHYGHSHP